MRLRARPAACSSFAPSRTSRASPAGCPKLSLYCLKPSRSNRASSQVRPSASVAQAWSRSSSSLRRFESPVSGSVTASVWVSRSSAVLAERDKETEEHGDHRRGGEDDRDRAYLRPWCRGPPSPPRRRRTRAAPGGAGGRSAGGGARSSSLHAARRCRASTQARARRGTSLRRTSLGGLGGRYRRRPRRSRAPQRGAAAHARSRPGRWPRRRRGARGGSHRPLGTRRPVATAASEPPVESRTTRRSTAATTEPAASAAVSPSSHTARPARSRVRSSVRSPA